MSDIRIIIADDHRVIRDGLRSLINKESDMQTVAEAATGRELLSILSDTLCDVIIMDIGMPGLNGIEATRQILADRPKLRVLALSMHSDKRMVTGMLSAGASGYLLKDCAYDEVARAIRTVASQRTYLSPGIADVVVEDYVNRVNDEGTQSAFTVLSPREREVLQLMAEGNATKEIAAKLHISVKTVETHRRQIMEKLDIRNVAELTKYAVREGLTSLE